MKSGKNTRKIKAAVLLSVAALIAAFLLIPRENSFPEKARSFVTACRDLFGEDVCGGLSGGDLPLRRGNQMTDAAQRLFSKRKDLETVYRGGEGTLDFYFSWSNFQPEGTRYLIYREDDRLEPSITGICPDEWVTEESENAVSVTGFGVGGKGYFKMERVMPCWFTVEAYYPT